MASKPAADRFLAAPAKAASVRVTLALAAAAALLALVGCGGGGGSTAATTGPAAASAPAPGQGEAAKAGGEGTSSPGQAGKAEGQQGTSASLIPSGASAGAPGAKRGPGITPPKGPQERGATPAEAKEATVADITLTSPPLLVAEGSPTAIPFAYTCDGKDTWPTLHWQGVPQGTKELALYAMSVKPVQGKLVYDWAVAGLDPALEELQSGKLPKGAVTATNSFGKTGYEICPESTETYVFALFALPKRLSPVKGFDPGAFRDQVLAVSGDVGLLAASYSH